MQETKARKVGQADCFLLKASGHRRLAKKQTANHLLRASGCRSFIP
ncbi:hypothetical protein CSC18_2634 [Klebsiella aerogenes]|nr:hypothetical protein CSC18_2634 [Klebsiella aerogenes]